MDPPVTVTPGSLEQHADLLGRISALLESAPTSDGPDLGRLLDRFARLAVPLLGDLCALDVVDAAGTVRRAACAHVDATKERLAGEAHARYGFRDDDPGGVPAAIRTRHSILVSPVTPGALARTAQDAEQLELLRRIGPRAWMVVPLVAQRRALGALTLAITESPEREYDRGDLLFAEAVASQVALALDHGRLYREAATARAAAEASARAKDEFLSTLSHELRSPLNAVYGWTTLLERGQLDAEQSRRAFQVILRNVNTQVRLIDDLLDLSRVASGKIRLVVQPVDLHAVVEEALDSIRPAADAKGIRLEPVLESPGGPISGDRDRLQQVVWNLLGNAVKFTPRGGRVQVRLRRTRSQIELVVSDTGQGIGTELLPHVFERFRQGAGAADRPHTGLGLGLALVRALVELHGGTVLADSAGPGAGATFLVRLPVMLAGVAAPEPPADASEAAPAARSAAAMLAGLRVLVVDDDPVAVEMNRALLTRAGAEVRGHSAAADAFDAVGQWRPDVVVSDIEMPDLDGYALVRKIRALDPDRGGKTPVLALSAYSRPEDRIRSLRAGFNAHVSKPVEPSELTALVASLAGRAGW